jgi:hypothetical protein
MGGEGYCAGMTTTAHAPTPHEAIPGLEALDAPGRVVGKSVRDAVRDAVPA